jgi:hypothetical protein
MCRPKTKIEKEVEIKCNRQSEQTKPMNTNAYDQFEDLHVINTVFLPLAPSVEQN